MIKSVDFHLQPNNVAHRTIEITEKQLIVRRGQSFRLTLNVAQPFNDHDMLMLTVETGSFPSEKRGTRSEFGNPSPMYSSEVKAIWKYSIDSSSNLPRGIVTLSVTPPADAPVGRYSLSAKTRTETATLGTLVVLFNPWCSDDWVYLPDEKERQEYVMNEQGIIYVGTANFPQRRDWVFGQFEEDMVDICLKLLDVNPKHIKDPADDVSARCNPIYVSRVLSAMINCYDDQGVLTGRWDGVYTDGEQPSSWLGSVRILRKWYKANCHPVKYGQCWVFAAVMCTVMRFFGIPCRVVTNFQSAHDTNSNLTIDSYYDEHGAIAKDSQDRVWNFHVWVEGWMKRPDLKKGDVYDGWQVLDPTPQEKSEGQYCCGPAPVAAILQGHTDLKYDVPFVFAEVNADTVKWLVSGNRKQKMSSDTMRVGQSISTKAVGCYTRDDITDKYKHTEGTMKEREVFNRAVNRVNSREEQEGDAGKEPVKFEMKIEKVNRMQNGQDINLELKLRNRDCTNKTMSIYINAQAMRYNGVPVGQILNTVEERTVPSGKEMCTPIRISFRAYSNHMPNCDSIKVSVVAINKHKVDDIYQTETDISMEQPSISMKVLGEARLNRNMEMEVEFKNPLDVPLRNCSLTVTGSGMYRFVSVERKMWELPPNSTWTLTFTVVPCKLGPRIVVADFDCSAFRDVTSSCIVNVKL